MMFRLDAYQLRGQNINIHITRIAGGVVQYQYLGIATLLARYRFPDIGWEYTHHVEVWVPDQLPRFVERQLFMGPTYLGLSRP